MLFDRQGRCLNINMFGLDRMGVTEETVIGRHFSESFPEDVRGEVNDAMEIAANGSLSTCDAFMVRPDGELVDWTITFVPIFEDGGDINYFFGISSDISEYTKRKISGLTRRNVELEDEIRGRVETEEQLRSSIVESELFLKGLHHSIKNQLAVLSGLLRLQSSVTKDKEAADIMTEGRNRIKTIALLHESLYGSGGVGSVEMSGHVGKIISYLLGIYGIRNDHIALVTDIPDVRLDMDTAMHCGLIINEIVSNALGHAFPDGRRGEIRISLSTGEDDTYELSVADNGVGLKEGFDPKSTETLGLQIVFLLVDQLGGEMELNTKGGTGFRIRFARGAMRKRGKH